MLDNTQIIIAIIGFLGAIISVIITSKSTQEKLINEIKTQDKLQDEKIDRLVVDLKKTNEDLKEKIDTQNNILNLKIEHLTEAQTDMKKNIESHNNYAKLFAENIPVMSEKISVANKRIADLEADVKHYHG